MKNYEYVEYKKLQWIIYILRKDSLKLSGWYSSKQQYNFPQKQNFLENELICLRGSGESDINALDLDDYPQSGFAFFR